MHKSITPCFLTFQVTALFMDKYFSVSKTYSESITQFDYLVFLLFSTCLTVWWIFCCSFHVAVRKMTNQLCLGMYAFVCRDPFRCPRRQFYVWNGSKVCFCQCACCCKTIRHPLTVLLLIKTSASFNDSIILITLMRF